jgi:hypothetical protein
MSCEPEQTAYDVAYKKYILCLSEPGGNPKTCDLHNLLKLQGDLDACNAKTNVGQAMVTLGDYTYLFVVESLEGRILYSKWKLGDGPSKWHEVGGGGGNGRTDAAPAAAVVEKSNYIFISIKEPVTGNLRLNQGVLNPSGQDIWVGWR